MKDIKELNTKEMERVSGGAYDNYGRRVERVKRTGKIIIDGVERVFYYNEVVPIKEA